MTDDVLVTADWVESNLDAFQDDDSDLRLVEINNPTVTDESEYTPYEEGHIPGALNFEWDEVFTDETERDIVSKADFAERNGAAGIDADTTVVVYGGGRVPNWFALFGYWIYTYYGHDDVRVIDGGKGYWVDNDYPLSTEAPDFTSREYEARGPFESVRAYKDDIDKAIEEGFRWSTCARPRSSPARSSPRGAQRDGPARRPHPRREQRPDRDHPERGRHVQERRRAPRAVRGRRRRRRRVDDHLLPRRRALVDRVVPAPRAARLRRRSQLRRLVDRVGNLVGAPIETGE